MSTQDDERGTGISDEDLPEDLQPTEDNPLAQPLSDQDDANPADELDVLGGKTPEQPDELPDGQAGEDHATDTP